MRVRTQSLVQQANEFSNLIELLGWRARRQPDRLAYIYLSDGETEESHLTYGMLDRRARAIATKLQSLNLTGERALLVYPAGLDFIAGFFGCVYAGVVAVPVAPPRPNRSVLPIRAVLADTEAAAILTTAPAQRRLQALRAQISDLNAVPWLSTDTIVDDVAGNRREPTIGGDTLAFLQYTSGSTAEPKGVMVSHGNLLHNERMIHQAFEHTEDSTGVGWLPLYHDMGLIGNVLQPLYAGATCVLMAPEAFLLKPFRWLQAISRYRGHTSGAPNFAYNLCIRKITSEQRATLDLSSWRLAFTGAEPVRAEDIERFATIFEPCGFRPEAFYPCYGLAEATLMVSGGQKTAPHVAYRVSATSLKADRVVEASIPDEQAQILVGCGKTLAGQQIVIVHPKSRIRCQPDEIGEIWVSGPSVTLGYWNRTEETAQTYGAYLADTGEGPFLRSGDLGFLHEGELFVTGRLKDLIIIGGQNHYPQDIERTVEQSHPSLLAGSCAAFSVDLTGEEQLIIIAEVGRRYLADLQGDTARDFESNRCAVLNHQEVIEAIRRAIAEHHDLRAYEILLVPTGTIPKTSSGKLQRSACRVKFIDGNMEILAQETQ